MDREHVLAVADAVEKSVTYDQDRFWFERCGAPACIAGHAVALSGGQHAVMCGERKSDIGRRTFVTAQAYLEISHDTAITLFICDGLRDPEDKHQAARTLRHLAETGEIDWEVGA